jgi:uncharacterized oligopeptide transporter (OPT) family protein
LLAGGVFSWLVLMPAIHFFGAAVPTAIFPGTVPIAQMGITDLWRAYVRPMGAGAVAMAGLITLIKTMPTIVSAVRASLKQLGAGKGEQSNLRTERDLPITVTVGGSVLLIIMMWVFLTFKPIPGAQTSMFANLLASIFVVVFGFLFVTVSSRITGLIGSSANPVSGMTIATLMATTAIFLALGWTAPAFGALALAIGGVVCIASSNAGDTSQDLKTGFLLGSTPRAQQIALLIGVTISTFAVGRVLIFMNDNLEEFHPLTRQVDINHLPAGVSVEEQSFSRDHFSYRDAQGKQVTLSGSGFYLLNVINSNEIDNGKYLYNPKTGQIEVQWIQGIGSEHAAAPQARLMSTVINGILSHKLPWRLVMLGVFLVIVVELLGVRSLPFAVGAYLSIGTTLAIFAGGMVRWLVEAVAKRKGEAHVESDVSPGSLFASGLIAAGGVMGLIGVGVRALEYKGVLPENSLNWGQKLPATGHSNLLAVFTFLLLGAALYYFARKPLESKKE